MGTTDSKQKLGERVIAARRKLDEDIKLQTERAANLETQSPQTMQAMIQSIDESFQSYSPFLEPTLLMAWKADPVQCKKIMIRACKKVLNAPIVKEEYQWFMKYVFPSSVWMLKTSDNRFMYEELLDVCNNMSKGIINTMDSIYNHLQSHSKWTDLMNIKNSSVISRQDHKSVGLLQGKGVRDILESKEEETKSSEDIQTFIDSNLAINTLTTTAKKIDTEFQNYMQASMSRFGDVKPGPMKAVERCLSKLENDYQSAQYPKSAKLLDLVRCSVTFNTVDQLIAGYHGLMGQISKKSSDLELARVKNGFLNKNFSGGYRDIKVNVVYHSSINAGVSMICEVQLLLNQYLHEKKRIHKLYSIIRQQLYFKMTVSQENEENNALSAKNVSELKFEPILDASEIGGIDASCFGKCSVDKDLGLLAMETKSYISTIDIAQKKIMFTETRSFGSNYTNHSHNFMHINNQKYLSVQTDKNIIKFFQINKFKDEDYKYEEDKALRICLGETDVINSCEFDTEFENIFLVKNRKTFEKRLVKKGNEVVVSVKLEQEIDPNLIKSLSLSNGGDWCVIAGGSGRSYFYLVDIEQNIQYKLTSTRLRHSWAPCFINGAAEYVAVGGKNKIEIWNVETKLSTKVIETGSRSNVYAMYSTNNILAVGSDDNKLSLLDVNTWNMFHSENYKIMPFSVHLTEDSKYLTIGGQYGEKCVILEIK